VVEGHSLHKPSGVATIIKRNEEEAFCDLKCLQRRTNSPEIQHMTLEERITIEADKRSGKPCIRGMRITVYDVFEWLASGMSAEAIIEEYPELTVEDIRACYKYAANREKRLLTA